MVELVDALDSKSSGLLVRVGSIPTSGTMNPVRPWKKVWGSDRNFSISPGRKKFQRWEWEQGASERHAINLPGNVGEYLGFGHIWS